MNGRYWTKTSITVLLLAVAGGFVLALCVGAVLL